MSDAVTDVQAKIVNAAKKLIAESGISNASLQAIANEVGISKGSLYYYFKTKNSILLNIVNEDFRISKGIIQKLHAGELDNEGLKNEIYQGLEERLHKVSQNKLHLYLAYEAMIGNKEVRASYHDKYNDWLQDITEGFSVAFELPEKTSKIFAFFFICLMDGWCMQDIMGTETIDRAELLEFIQKIDLKEIVNALAKQ